MFAWFAWFAVYPNGGFRLQPFQGCAGFGRVTQGSSVRAGLANLATRGLSDAVPLGLRNRRGLAGSAQRVLYGFFPPPKIFQNSWRDWAVDSAITSVKDSPQPRAGDTIESGERPRE